MVWRGPTQRCSSLSACFHPVAKSRRISWPNSLRSSATVRSTSRVNRPRSPIDSSSAVAPMTTTSAPISSQILRIAARSLIWSGVKVWFIGGIACAVPRTLPAHADHRSPTAPHKPTREERPFFHRILASRQARRRVSERPRVHSGREAGARRAGFPIFPG